MDIKNSKNKYHISTGIPCFDTTPISESISLLLEEPIDYEFRTTVVKEHHSKNDFIQIGEWIHHAKAYYLQPYKESNDILSKGLSSPELLDLKCYQEALIPFVKKVEIRG